MNVQGLDQTGAGFYDFRSLERGGDGTFADPRTSG